MSLDKSNNKGGGFSGGNPAGLLQECLSCGLLVVGARERIVACTPEAAAHLDLKTGRSSKATLAALPPKLAGLIRNAARGGKPLLNRRIHLENNRGATTLAVNVWPLPALKETVVMLSQPAAAPIFEQNIRRLDQMANLGTLSAGMAHEIKNGMVAIRTFVELLVEKGEDRELTDVVGRELKRIDSMVSQMLRFAAPARSAFAPLRVHDVLDHSLLLIGHRLGGKLISFNRRYAADPDTVHGDEHQLQQAFMNLLFNAIEAMGADGVLTVSTETAEARPGGRQVRIHIQDTGMGIPPENLKRLFEPFFTTKKTGTGLGLTICQRIVHEHRGTIRARSGVNQGSTFSISLPLLGSPSTKSE
jgi:signal transduction histidine kinase